MAADQALQLLIDGNKRYMAGHLTAPIALTARHGKQVDGKTLFAAIVCCSDSRVPPEYIFDQTLGQLFVIRVAGQVLDAAARPPAIAR